eukprot:COSAG04_NODE_1332_length_7195_cov_7.711105_5_plen_205_part_00
MATAPARILLKRRRRSQAPAAPRFWLLRLARRSPVSQWHGAPRPAPAPFVAPRPCSAQQAHTHQRAKQLPQTGTASAVGFAVELKKPPRRASRWRLQPSALKPRQKICAELCRGFAVEESREELVHGAYRIPAFFALWILCHIFFSLWSIARAPGLPRLTQNRTPLPPLGARRAGAKTAKSICHPALPANARVRASEWRWAART